MFWALCPKYEETLQQPTDRRLQEDQQFLEKLRKGEKVVVGKLDVKLLKHNESKASEEARLLTNQLKLMLISTMDYHFHLQLMQIQTMMGIISQAQPL